MNEIKENPNYYAIIPANVRYDEKLRDKAKLLYGEIIALSNKNGYCYASNKYFADLYKVSKMTISLLIKELVENGYIETEIKYKDGSKEIEYRYIKILIDPYIRNLIDPYIRNLIDPIYKNLKENNTSINNTSINNNIYSLAEQDKIPYGEIINYLNDKAKVNYKSTTKKTKDCIKARFNEGFNLEDFKKVIDIKTKEWLNDKTMCKYLRPETLFGTKFESYLNQKEKKSFNEILDEL